MFVVDDAPADAVSDPPFDDDIPPSEPADTTPSEHDAEDPTPPVEETEGAISPATLVWGGLRAIPLSVAYAVIRHRVLDIAVVLRRSLQYLLARRALQAAVALPIAAAAYTIFANRDQTIAQLNGVA